MQVKLLKDIVSLVAGQQGAKIVDLLHDKKNVNEFLIAKKLGLTINQTRNILYKLAEGGFVSFIRKKDAKKGGWYTYFWTLNPGKSLGKFRETLLKNLDELRSKLSLRSSAKFFYCQNCNIEYNEEDALGNNYTCVECGEALELKNNEGEVSALQKDILKNESILKEVEGELGEIGAKEQKSRTRKMKAEQKKKENERAARRKERARISKREKMKKKSRKVKK